MTLAPMPTTVHTVADLLMALMLRFPKHQATLEAWSGSYRRTLGHLQPTRLEEVWFAVIDEWAYREPPKPADFKAKLGGDAKPEAPTSPEAVANGKRNRAINDAHSRRDNLAKAICAATFERYGHAIEEAAQRVGVKAEDMRHRLKTMIGWPGLCAQKGTRSFDAAHAHVFGSEPLVEFIHLTADDWHSARRYAEIKRDRPDAFDLPQAPGFRPIGDTGRTGADREARRRASIEAQDGAA